MKPWRDEVGGAWDEIGSLQRDFLLEQGLRRDHFFLDVGCGPLRGGVKIIPHLEPRRYYGVDRNPGFLAAGLAELSDAELDGYAPSLTLVENLDLSSLPAMFDVAWAHSLFTHLKIGEIERCLREVQKLLRGRGCFYATFFRTVYPQTSFTTQCHDPLIHSYRDRDPYHYTHREMIGSGLRAGFRDAEYLGGWGHPRNQMMMAYRK